MKTRIRNGLSWPEYHRNLNCYRCEVGFVWRTKCGDWYWEVLPHSGVERRKIGAMRAIEDLWSAHQKSLLKELTSGLVTAEIV